MTRCIDAVVISSIPHNRALEEVLLHEDDVRWHTLVGIASFTLFSCQELFSKSKLYET